jgi:2-amino-4-hydroxy-6-hydroxymethyldihydropteridine diphosphokinase
MIPSGKVEAYLSLGSNLGGRLGFLKRGISLISELPGVKMQEVSGVYETEPVGYIEQPEFLNLVVCILTSAEPHDLLRMLKEVEIKVGRVHRDKWHEREIDIDIIFYGDKVLNSKDLIIPHPRMHLRKFVLQPLNEIASNCVHPVKQKEVVQLLTDCLDNSRVIRTEQFLVPLT